MPVARKWITEVITESLDLDGDVSDVVKRLSSLEAENPGYRNLKIEIVGDDYYTERRLYGDRLETDGEYSKRVKQLERSRISKEKAKKREDEWERKEYDRLKKKFAA